jgi:hypothetical protein
VTSHEFTIIACNGGVGQPLRHPPGPRPPSRELVTHTDHGDRQCGHRRLSRPSAAMKCSRAHA